ncbi:MAG TPA: hypothetical protein VGH80_15045 [Xanthomonadaceae bacterium]|jgi:hypothetical protein
MDLLHLLAAMLVMWVGAQYLLGPIVVWLTLSIPERYVYPRLDPSDLLADDYRAQPLHDDLLRLGFVPAGASRVQVVSGLYYAHPEDGAAACIMLAPKYACVAFFQHHAHARLHLSNSRMPSPYPSWDRKIGHVLPGCRDVEELFRHFRTLRTRLALPGPVRASVDHVLAMSEAFENDQLERLLAIGYFARTPRNGRRRATFKGALRMAWKLARPSRLIIVMLASRRARAAVDGA